MKKLLCSTILLALAIVFPIPTMAGVDISIGIALPPPVVFAAPPAVVVLPDTYDVYVVPDIDVDLFFWNGWWWRPWEGRWYRSRYYNRGWVYYSHVPSFYFDVDPGWRRYYIDHDWHGHRWNYERIPYRQFQQNWRGWHDNHYWERKRTWGIQGYKRPPQQQMRELRHQRQEQYQQRPEVQRHQQQMQGQQRQHRVQKPQQHQQPKQQHSQPRGQQRQAEPQHKKPKGEPERGE